MVLRVLFLTGFLLFAWLAFRRRHRIRAVLWGVFGIWLARYFQPVSDWLQTLGEDSLAEAQRFALSEAWFFLKTLSATLVPMHWDRVLVLVAVAAAATAAVAWGLPWLAARAGLRISARWAARGLAWLGVLCIAIPLGREVAEVAPQFRSNSDIYASARKNFSNETQRITLTGKGVPGMRVVVYIGESTTSAHWDLYGYPLSTTPQLRAFSREHRGLLKFEHVVSTQTLTSQSLLEALSIGLPGGSDYVPITERPRVSLVEVLKQLHIPTFLMSTQGNSGVWNLASSIIFSAVDSKTYASATSALGQSAAQGEESRVWDDVFFSDALQRFKAFHPQGRAVAFLHSYAGHGVYADHIPPEARRTGDTFLDEVSPSLIYGEGLAQAAGEAGMADGMQARIKTLLDGVKGGAAKPRHVIAEYDDAMRYIDGNLARLFRQAASDEAPTVVLYFSDHGESPETGLGHDSSRFQHEMTRVPFLMYFNDAAQQADPALYSAFREASGRASTLAQVPATIFTLLGYRVQGSLHDYRGMGLDPEESLVPIVVRKLVDGMVYVRAHGLGREQRPDARDLTDPATNLWLNSRSRSGGGQASALCYGEANTWAKATRGANVADCLAARLVMDGTSLDLAPRNKDASGWALNALAGMASSHRLPVWLDAGALPSEALCTRLGEWLSARADAQPGGGEGAPHPLSVMLALAPGAGEVFPAPCAALRGQGVDIFAHVPPSMVGNADEAGAWSNSLAAAGWPAHYVVPREPGAAWLGALLAHPGAQWALAEVSVDALPWRAAASAPPPAFVLVNTAWDPNSRH
ncbi:Phosphoethanolamine transferase CptA [Pigmentiphaga humi]|uniref:Phosphoethanolamine transferase CptA n=1 Tax=Pigmentiphaga humi TaxID=2478468 RepID=A0A3P4B741_9BURK|nr:sulfatase-like hydrolase/transferase [Pigmentiphaga humi]VCU71420.1 Phosphoethanolamine transferase CptA [Pigmentiphaga humi]